MDDKPASMSNDNMRHSLKAGHRLMDSYREVILHGATKYAPDDWINHSAEAHLAAAKRHLDKATNALEDSGWYDESGLPHIDHVVTRLAMASYLIGGGAK